MSEDWDEAGACHPRPLQAEAHSRPGQRRQNHRVSTDRAALPCTVRPV